MRIKRDIGKRQLCTQGGGGVLLGVLDRDVPLGSSNRDPISDRYMPFSIRLYALENNTRFQTIMVTICIRFQTKTAQKAYSSESHIPVELI